MNIQDIVVEIDAEISKLQQVSRCASFADGRIEYEGFARARLVE